MPIFITENHNALVTAMLESAQAPLRKRITELEQRVQELEDALQRCLSWLTSYPGKAALGKNGPYDQARAVLAKKVGVK